MTQSPNDRYVINGLRLALTLMHTQVDNAAAEDKQSMQSAWQHFADEVNAEISKRGGTTVQIDLVTP
jgi:hypothetical protein